MALLDPHDPYFIDFPQRVRAVQAAMAEHGIDVYLGSRLRTLSWITGAFCPWRSFIVIPPEGTPTVFTFVIDASRVADDSWLDADHVLGYAPMGGQDQVSAISDMLGNYLLEGKGTIGIETGMGSYTPEGHLTHFEYEQFSAAFPGARLVNAHDILDALAVVKDRGTINRFREASRLVDIGQEAVYAAIKDGGYRGMTETEISGYCHLRHAQGGQRVRVDLHRRQ